MRALLVVFMVALSATPAEAAKQDRIHGFRQFDIYAREAAHTFSRPIPCDVKFQRVADEWLYEKHQDRGVLAEGDLTTCTIRYGVRWWRIANPRWRCWVMVHEIGHLLGLTHEHDRYWPIMSVTGTDMSGRTCKSLRPHRRGGHYTWTYRPPR